MAYFWARVLMGTIDAAWLNFINSILALFMLPLAILRWTWWRLNIWGEIVGFVGAIPLGYLVWFVLGFKDAPYWQSFALLTGSGWALILGVTFATRPESPEVLRKFWLVARPPGFWGPVTRELGDDLRRAHGGEIRADLLAAGAGMVACVSMCVGFAALFSDRLGLASGMVASLVFSVAIYARLQMRASRLRAVSGD